MYFYEPLVWNSYKNMTDPVDNLEFGFTFHSLNLISPGGNLEILKIFILSQFYYLIILICLIKIFQLSFF